MIRAETVVIVSNPQGIHARPSALIVKAASRFTADVCIENPAEGCVVDAKSILEVMTIVAPQGTELVVRAEGDDASAAVERLAGLIGSGFGED